MPPCLISLICSWAGPWVWVQEEVKNGWKYTAQITEGGILLPFTAREYAKPAKDDQNPLLASQGTRVKRSSSSTLAQIKYLPSRRLYKPDNLTSSAITFQMKSWCVSTLPSLERTILLPDLSGLPGTAGKHAVQGSFSVPTVLHTAQADLTYFPSPVHEVLKGEKLQTSSSSAFRSFPSIFLLPFSFLCTALQMEASGSKRIIS